MVLQQIKANNDRLVVYVLISLIFLVLVFLGFYNSREPEKIVWACNPQPFGTPGAKPFDELNSDSQAFVLEQWREEKSRFESLRVGYEEIAKKLAEKIAKIILSSNRY